MQDHLKELKEMIKTYGSNREGMRGLKEWFLNDVMNEEAEEQLNASRYERNANRKDYRNGYKLRSVNNRWKVYYINFTFYILIVLISIAYAIDIQKYVFSFIIF